jgi:hypothetical protein
MSENDPENPAQDEPSLASAIEALAKALQHQPESNAPSAWNGLKSLVQTLLPSLVMFGLGYTFIQGVELDLKREEFTASSADKLKSYVEMLMTSTFGEAPEKLRATALALGGFGGVAAFPLLSIVESGGEAQISAAVLGLEQAGRVAPEATCTVVATAIDDRTSAYKWGTRKAVAEVAGVVGCSEARGPLERLQTEIESMAELNPEQQKNFKNTVDKALMQIDAAGRGTGSWW